MITIVVFTGHLTYGFTNVKDTLGLTAGYSWADRYVQDQANGKYFSTNAPVAWFENGLGRVNFPPHTKQDLDRVAEEHTVSYLLVDYIYNRLPYPSVTQLMDQCTPEKIVPNPLALSMPVLLETYLNFEYCRNLTEDPNTGKILIFKLPACRKKL
jgi:hypothetical protein